MDSPTVFISYSHKDEKEKDALLIKQAKAIHQVEGLLNRLKATVKATQQPTPTETTHE